jgi:hypothetical protein
MGSSTLYDEDILLWSEQQAAVIRELGRTRRDLPNELDVENVAEEVESVGRSELATVKSSIRLVLVHLINLAVEPESQSVPHWLGEVVAFHAELVDRYTPSMRQRIHLNERWRSAREQSMLAYQAREPNPITLLPANCPFTFDDLLAERIDSLSLVQRLGASE